MSNITSFMVCYGQLHLQTGVLGPLVQPLTAISFSHICFRALFNCSEMATFSPSSWLVRAFRT